MERRFGPPEGSERAVLHNYRAYFYRPDGNDLVKSNKERVYGVAYWLTRKQLRQIEEWKKSLSDFKTIRVSVDIGGSRVPALTQVLRRKRNPVQPSRQYLRVIIQGLREHGWGDQALESWKSAAWTREESAGS